MAGNVSFVINGETTREYFQLHVSSYAQTASITVGQLIGDKTKEVNIDVDLDELYNTIMSAKGWKLDREMEQTITK